MKLSRILAAGAGTLLVGASVFAGASAAQADDFYLGSTFPQHVDGTAYPAGWFLGDVSPAAAGTASSTAAGFEITGGPLQLLNGSPVLTDLTDAAATAGIVVSSGQASFQIPVFTAAGGAFTTIYADQVGIENDVWYTSNAYGPFAAGDTATIAAFEAEMASDYEILGFGFNTVGTGTKAVASISWNGDTYWFLAAPTVALSPSTVETSKSVDTTFTLSATGFIPGETVESYLSTESSGGILPFGGTADANGAVSIAITFDEALPVGSYTVGAFGNTSSVNASAALTITADTLPDTGVEPAAALIGGGALLAAGAAFVIIAARRRAAASN